MGEEAEEEERGNEEASGRRTARTGKTYSPRKKGQKQKRGALEDESDGEATQSDDNKTPMQQVLRVARNRGSSPNRVSLFSSPDNSPPRRSNTRHRKNSHLCVDCEVQ